MKKIIIMVMLLIVTLCLIESKDLTETGMGEVIFKVGLREKHTYVIELHQIQQGNNETISLVYESFTTNNKGIIVVSPSSENIRSRVNSVTLVIEHQDTYFLVITAPPNVEWKIVIKELNEC
jgi:hypothetical protein